MQLRRSLISPPTHVPSPTLHYCAAPRRTSAHRPTQEDTADEVRLKIKKAFCPPGEIEKNPCVEYVQYIVLPWFGKLEVERGDDNGGCKAYTTYEELVEDYKARRDGPSGADALCSCCSCRRLAPGLGSAVSTLRCVCVAFPLSAEREAPPGGPQGGAHKSPQRHPPSERKRERKKNASHLDSIARLLLARRCRGVGLLSPPGSSSRPDLRVAVAVRTLSAACPRPLQHGPKREGAAQEGQGVLSCGTLQSRRPH